MNSTLLLYVCLSNPTRSALIANGSSTYAPAVPEFVLRDTVTLRIRFFERADSTGLLEQKDIGESITLAFGGKKTSEIATELDFLFFTNALVRNADDEDDIFWEGSLDLNTEEFIEAFGESDTTAALTCELEVSEGAERRTVAQFGATGIFDVIRGGEAAPTAAVPPMPSAPIDETLFGGVTGGWVQRTFAEVWQKFLDNVSLTFPWARVTDAPASFPPSGGAGGVLSGDYPNPGFAVDMATQEELDDEATTRANDDTALGQTIQGVADDLATEATARSDADELLIPLTQKGAANGVASLDAGGKVPAAQLPALSLTGTTTVADETARLALTAEQAAGQIVIDAATGKSWGLTTGGDPAESGDWVQIGDREITGEDVALFVGDYISATTAQELADSVNSVIADLYSQVDGLWNQGYQTETQVKAYVDPLFLPRLGSDQIISDGATTSRAQIQTPGNRGNLASGVPATWRGLVPVPSASSTAGIAGVSSSTSALASATAWSLGIAWSANDLVVRCNGATPATDYRTYTLTGLRTTYSGQTIELEVYSVAGTTAPVVKVNGVTIAGTSADGAGTDTDWLSASLVSTYHVTGYTWPVGPAPLGGWILGSLTSEERTAWRTTGKPPAWVVRGGSAANATPASLALSLGAADGATLPTGVGGGGGGTTNSAVADTRTGGAGAYVMRVESNGANSMTEYNNWGNIRGRKFYFRFWARRVSGSATSVIFGVTDELGFTNNTVSGLTTSWQQFTGFAWGRGPGSGGLTIGVASAAAGDQVEFDDIEVFPAGALSLSLIQRGGVIGDATNLGDNPARLVGHRVITDHKDFQWTATIDTASTGNKQLLGGAVFTDPLQTSIDSIDRNGTGAETASVGDGTTVAKYSASAAKTAIRNRLALAENYPADAGKTGLYYDVTVAAAAGSTTKLTVRGHMIP